MEFFIYFLLFKNNLQLIVAMLGFLAALRIFDAPRTGRLYKLVNNLFFLICGFVASVELFRFYFYIDMIDRYFSTIFNNFLEVIGLATVFSVILFLSRNKPKCMEKRLSNSQKFSIYEV